MKPSVSIRFLGDHERDMSIIPNKWYFRVIAYDQDLALFFECLMPPMLEEVEHTIVDVVGKDGWHVEPTGPATRYALVKFTPETFVLAKMAFT